MKKISRRNALKTIGAATGASLIGIPSVAFANSGGTANKEKLKIVFVGAHPDDPESICGGTMALFSNAGHEVVSAYLTRGEAGIEGKSYEEASSIRTLESLEACKILKARPEFLGQIDGNCVINKEEFDKMKKFLAKEDPDIVFTHWPIDTHRDHRVCSSLVLDAWYNMERKFDLYYCEAMTGEQSHNFSPTHYVDITSVIKQKHSACYVHKSQKAEEWYPTSHARMEVFRGMEYICEYAEAFVKHFQKPQKSII